MDKCSSLYNKLFSMNFDEIQSNFREQLPSFKRELDMFVSDLRRNRSSSMLNMNYVDDVEKKYPLHKWLIFHNFQNIPELWNEDPENNLMDHIVNEDLSRVLSELRGINKGTADLDAAIAELEEDNDTSGIEQLQQETEEMNKKLLISIRMAMEGCKPGPKGGRRRKHKTNKKHTRKSKKTMKSRRRKHRSARR